MTSVASLPVAPGQLLSMMDVREGKKALLTRFGDLVDVRHRGALKLNRFAGSQAGIMQDAPAVVRLWIAQQCHELSAHEARALAQQLLAAAALAEQQNII